MQKLDDTLQLLNETTDKLKARVKEGAKEVERLRMERADIEKQAKAAQSEVEDGRVIGLYDWCVVIPVTSAIITDVNDAGSRRRLRSIGNSFRWNRSLHLLRMSSG